ncbi:hypothetical protein JTB14_030872 [Gonioctena quinquepunctata]|nr:hypothetical protein JTB14_030872 [Gonioctena quinquepunctata]
MEINKLEPVPQKTEAVILRGAKAKDGISFTCRGVEILPKKSLVNLGITIGENCSLREHIKIATQKAEKKAAVLSRITPNIKGPGSRKCSFREHIKIATQKTEKKAAVLSRITRTSRALDPGKGNAV